MAWNWSLPYARRTLALAWSASGSPYTGCATAFLDCSTTRPDGRPNRIFPDTDNPFSVPAVTCGPGDRDRVLRVFWGMDCPLVTSTDCFWNATQQAFVGPNCYESPVMCAPSKPGGREIVSYLMSSDFDVTSSREP